MIIMHTHVPQSHPRRHEPHWWASLYQWQRTLLVVVVLGALVISAGLIYIWIAHPNGDPRPPNHARRDGHAWASISAWNGRVLVLEAESTIESAALVRFQCGCWVSSGRRCQTNTQHLKSCLGMHKRRAALRLRNLETTQLSSVSCAADWRAYACCDQRFADTLTLQAFVIL
jgi:hypothetical protein